MIDISNTQKRLAGVFLGVFLITLALYQLIPSKGASHEQLEGYVQIVENISLPILMAEQTQQFNLQIGALTRGTPIRQVRIFDTSRALLFRAQTAEVDADIVPATYARPLVFENKAIGFLEVDIDRDTAGSADFLRSIIIATILATAVTVGIFFLFDQKLRVLLPRDDEKPANIKDTNNPAEDVVSTKSVFNTGSQLLLVVRTANADRSADKEQVLTKLSELANDVRKMADIYDAYQVDVGANIIVLSIKGHANGSNLHQAVMLCWGITQLSESIQTQSFLVHTDEFSSMPEDRLAFWSELDGRCNGDKRNGAFVTKALTENVDQSAFELSASQEDFMHISATSASIKKLWLSQQASASQK